MYQPPKAKGFKGGPGDPPPGFVVGQTSATEWVIYWAMSKVFGQPDDPREVQPLDAEREGEREGEETGEGLTERLHQYAVYRRMLADHFGQDEEAVVRYWCGRSGIPWLGRADIGHDVDNRIVPFGMLKPDAT